MRDNAKYFVQLKDKLMNKSKLEDLVTLDLTVLDEIRSLDYFKANMNYCGEKPIGSTCDKLVWGLVNQGAPSTVVLLGSHDARHLTGLALSLDLLRVASEAVTNSNILFVSAPFATMDIKKLLNELSKTFELNYSQAISYQNMTELTETQIGIATGTVGKIMPILVAKGMKTRTDAAYCGLNSISIMMEIVKAIELNTEMGDVAGKRMTPPPAFLHMNSVGVGGYDITPSYSVGYFSWLYLKDNLPKKLEQLRELCKWSMEDAINQFNYSYNEYLRKQCRPSYCECMEFDFEILLYDELIRKLSTKIDLTYAFKVFSESHRGVGDNELSIKWITHLIELLNVNHPVIVIGILSPFYPVLNSEAFYAEHLRESFARVLEVHKLELICEPFYMGMSEANGLGKGMPGILSQMPVYNMDSTLTEHDHYDLGIDILLIGINDIDHLDDKRLAALYELGHVIIG